MLHGNHCFLYCDEYRFGVEPYNGNVPAGVIWFGISPQESIAWQVTNEIVVDLAVAKAAPTAQVEQFGGLPKLALSRPCIMDRLRSYVESIDMGGWSDLCRKNEYTWHQLKKRKWPVKKRNNLPWQETALRLGLVKQVYAEHAFKKRGPPAPVQEEDKGEDKEDEEDDGKEEDEKEAYAKRVVKYGAQIKILDEKAKAGNKDLKIRELRLRCNYGVYCIPEVTEEEDAEQIFSIIATYDECLAYEYMARMLVSRKRWHGIIKGPLVKKLAGSTRVHEVITWLAGYAVWMMLKEERLFGNRIRADSRAILTADQFRQLPQFDCELQNSPYFAELWQMRDSPSTLDKNLLMYLEGPRRQTTAAEFAARLSIISGGSLDGIDFAQHSAYMVGSCLAPCVVTNPLEGDKEFGEYAAKYYPGYPTEVRARIAQLRKSIMAVAGVWPHIDDDDESFIAAATSTLEEHAIDWNVIHIGEVKYLLGELIASVAELNEAAIADIDIAVMAASAEDYDRKVLALFEQMRARMGNPTRREFTMNRFATIVSYKWIFRGTRLPRSMDVFRTPSPPHKLVFAFHLNIVKMWWDGRGLFLLGSAACAALTGVNQWYRWFSNNKDPIAIVLKNMARGYTVLLNEAERSILLDYVREVDQFKRLDDKITVGKISVHHPIFGGTEVAPQYWNDECPRPRHRFGRLIEPHVNEFRALIGSALAADAAGDGGLAGIVR